MIYKAFTTGKIQDLAHMTERGQRVYHGDVIIVRCEEKDVPANFSDLKIAKNMVLAEGEHSGHAHALFNETSNTDIYVPPKLSVIEGQKDVEMERGEFDVRVTETGEMYLKITGEPKLLRHQEHTAFRIYPGWYQIEKQKEETWDGLIRSVVD